MTVRIRDYQESGVFNKKAYKRDMMRQYRAKKRKKDLKEKKNKCPRCEILLNVEFEQWHKSCQWYIENYIHPTLG